MALDLQQQREQAHALIDQLSAVKLTAVRSLLEVLIDGEDNDELTAEDIGAIEAGLHSANNRNTVSIEEVLSDFGLTLADFENLAAEHGPNHSPRGNG